MIRRRLGRTQPIRQTVPAASELRLTTVVELFTTKVSLSLWFLSSLLRSFYPTRQSSDRHHNPNLKS